MYRSIKTWFPIKGIERGIIELKNGNFCKVLEISPINFALKTQIEQENILYQYKKLFSVCNFDIQILVQSRKGNLEKHIVKIEKNIECEKDDEVKGIMREYVKMIEEESLKVAVSKKFYIIFLADKVLNEKVTKDRAIKDLTEKTIKIKEVLNKCGNDVRDFDKENDELINIIYSYLNPITSVTQKLKGVKYEHKSI